MKQKDPGGLPLCSLSAQCLRLVDELDPSNDSFASMDDIQDERLLDRLRTHLPTCPTCTATLAQARRVRAQQRTALRDLLADSEQKVPSTTSQIFAAIHSGENAARQAGPKLVGFPLEEIDLTPHSQQLNGWHPPSAQLPPMHRPRMILRNVLTLAAVAALILASIALFGRLVLMRSHPSVATTPIPPTKLVQQPTGVVSPVTTPLSPPTVGKSSTPQPASNGWNSVMIASTTTNGSVISNYDYLSGASIRLNSQQLPSNTRFDGVSPDGKNLLYQFSNSDDTMYFTLTQLPDVGFFYELNDGNAGNALWLDSRYVLIATVNSGVVKVDTQTGQGQAFLPSLKSAGIEFFRAGFLYFIGGADRALDALYRVNIASGVVQQLTLRSTVGNFWLSPDGSMVYFKNTGPAGLPGIYAVNSDGTNLRVLRPGGVPIGYAADNSLMIMQEVNSKFEVVKLGATPAQDQVVSGDIAPGAISICNLSIALGLVPICNSNIALAPYGHAIVVQAYYADGTRQVLSLDLTTGERIALQVPASGIPAQLIGWDKLPVVQR